MKSFSGTKKGGLALAIVLVIGGLCMIFHPIDMFISHPDELYSRGGSPSSEQVSKQEAREIGGGAMLLGVAFASFVLYRS